MEQINLQNALASIIAKVDPLAKPLFVEIEGRVIGRVWTDDSCVEALETALFDQGGCLTAVTSSSGSAGIEDRCCFFETSLFEYSDQQDMLKRKLQKS
jgi:hypothetical protein